MPHLVEWYVCHFVWEGPAHLLVKAVIDGYFATIKIKFVLDFICFFDNWVKLFLWILIFFQCKNLAWIIKDYHVDVLAVIIGLHQTCVQNNRKRRTVFSQKSYLNWKTMFFRVVAWNIELTDLLDKCVFFVFGNEIDKTFVFDKFFLFSIN